MDERKHASVDRIAISSLALSGVIKTAKHLHELSNT